MSSKQEPLGDFHEELGDGWDICRNYSYSKAFKKRYLRKVTYYNPNNKAERKEKTRPTSIQYYDDGTVNTIKYYKDGSPHRDNGLPSYYKFDDGVIYIISYYVEGVEHRDNDKPSYIVYNNQGEITHTEYWVRGKNVSEETKKRIKIKEKRKNILKQIKE